MPRWIYAKWLDLQQDNFGYISGGRKLFLPGWLHPFGYIVLDYNRDLDTGSGELLLPRWRGYFVRHDMQP